MYSGVLGVQLFLLQPVTTVVYTHLLIKLDVGILLHRHLTSLAFVINALSTDVDFFTGAQQNIFAYTPPASYSE
jgi:hypothetical protein